MDSHASIQSTAVQKLEKQTFGDYIMINLFYDKKINRTQIIVSVM